MGSAVDTIELNGFHATISYDENRCNPREEWDNVGTIICRSNRYGLGDENHTAEMDECDSWDEVENVIRKTYGKDCIMLPVYIYDHSGITINTTGFSCGWDSSRIGTIVVSREKARTEYGMKRITKTNLEKVIKYLEGEIETYDQYLTGDVYGYEIEDEEGEPLDSCWGFYGLEHVTEEVKQLLEHYNSKKQKEEGEQQELFVA